MRGTRNGRQTRMPDPSVLRDRSHAEQARDEIQNANNPWAKDQASRERHIALADVHARLAMAESIDLLARVVDGVWQQASRELVQFRTSRAGQNGADGEGRNV